MLTKLSIHCVYNCTTVVCEINLYTMKNVSNILESNDVKTTTKNVIKQNLII